MWAGEAVFIDTGAWIALALSRDFGAYRWKHKEPFRNLLVEPDAQDVPAP